MKSFNAFAGNFAKVSFIGLSAWVVLSCSSLSHQRDDVALAKVQKVAVVAFSADEPAPPESVFSLNTHQSQMMQGGSIVPQHFEDVNHMYKWLSDSYGKNMHWTVLDTPTMTQNPGYVTAYKNTMEGWQSKMPPNKGENRFIVDHVMDYDGPRILDRAGRDALIEALGVDAIIAAKVNVMLSASHPQAYLSFSLYVHGQDKPVWFEGQVKGDRSDATADRSDLIALSTLANRSAKTAFAKIGQTPN